MRDIKSEDEKKFKAIAAALGAAPETPRPPDEWWERHVKMIREQHPNYDEEHIDRAVGHIWYKGYKPEKREMALLDAAIHQT